MNSKALQKIGITTCKPRPNYKLWLSFNDGVCGEVDLSHLAGKGVFSEWLDSDFFNSVKIDPRSKTVVWGNNIDLDPYVLRDQVLGVSNS